MIIDDWVNELTLDNIPDGLYRKIAEEIGIDNLMKLVGLVGGSTLYIPKAESFSRPIRDKRVKEEFNGHNYTELALKYNLSERWVRRLCGEGWDENQLCLFGDYLAEM